MRTKRWPFLSLFASRRKRKLYYLGKDDFYQTRNALHSSTSFNFHRESFAKHHKTDRHIRFYGINFGLSLKEVKHRFGKPNYTKKQNLPLEHQSALFYKLNIKGIKCMLQMHFNEDQLFFAQIQLRDSSEKAKLVFLKLFRLKYRISTLEWDEVINDKDGARIEFKNDIVPKATFYSPEKSVWKNIHNELNAKAINHHNYSAYDLKNIALRWS